MFPSVFPIWSTTGYPKGRRETMPRYFFDVGGSIQVNDTIGQEVADRLELHRQALLEAASAGAQNARRGEETSITVTVRDLTGAVHLKVRLVSQVEAP